METGKLVLEAGNFGGRTDGYEGQYFDGTIGDVMIFKRDLTAREVQTLCKTQQ